MLAVPCIAIFCSLIWNKLKKGSKKKYLLWPRFGFYGLDNNLKGFKEPYFLLWFSRYPSWFSYKQQELKLISFTCFYTILECCWKFTIYFSHTILFFFLHVPRVVLNVSAKFSVSRQMNKGEIKWDRNTNGRKISICLKFFLQVRVCEERKNLEAQLPATSGSAVMRSWSFGLGGFLLFSANLLIYISLSILEPLRLYVTEGLRMWEIVLYVNLSKKKKNFTWNMALKNVKFSANLQKSEVEISFLKLNFGNSSKIDNYYRNM